MNVTAISIRTIQTSLSAASESGLVSSSSEFGGMPLPPAYYLIFQVSTASVSFLSSLAIAISIAFVGNVGLSTPYRRIIFGLSVSDILQSLALLTGPSSVPPSRFSADTANEAASCEANGFILAVGATCVVMYTFFLCLYYLCKLKYRMSDQSFKNRIETKLHVFIWVFYLASNIVAVAMDTIHTNAVFRSFCSHASTPTGCWTNPELVGECDEKNMTGVSVFIQMLMIVLPAVCFVGIIVSMALLYRHAFLWNQIIERELIGVPTSLRSTETGDEEKGDKPAQENETQSPQDRVQHLSRLYRRETMIQATSYVGAFFLTYVPLMIGYILTYFSLYPPAVSSIGIFFYPLGGLFNILVYTRPKVASLRRDHPQCSRLRGFWLVLRAGGEIPDDIESPPSCCECCRVPEWWQLDYEYTHHTATANRGEGTKTRSIGRLLSRLGF